jgi:hypothetical protein
MTLALNHVQSTSHAPPATASVNQGVAIFSGMRLAEGVDLAEGCHLLGWATKPRDFLPTKGYPEVPAGELEN